MFKSYSRARSFVDFLYRQTLLTAIDFLKLSVTQINARVRPRGLSITTRRHDRLCNCSGGRYEHQCDETGRDADSTLCPDYGFAAGGFHIAFSCSKMGE